MLQYFVLAMSLFAMLNAFPSHFRNLNLRKNTVQSSLRWKAFSAVTRSKTASSDEKVLVIVESPAKARTIQAIMGKNSNFLIDSCAGHIRDLSGVKKSPVKNHEPSMVFEPLKITSTDLGVDVHNNFQPFYVPIGGKAEIIQRLKEKAKAVDRILLATDEDREGESISWHLVEVLKPQVPYQRAVFHEITESAIRKAFEEPRDIDYNLVSAQETRRILDKIVGFSLSPVLWRHVSPRLSAGRVQSCGLNLIAEREIARWGFKGSQFYSVTCALNAPSSKGAAVFEAKLIRWQDRRVANDRDFDGASGEMKKSSSSDETIVFNETLATTALKWLADPATVFEVSERSTRTTSRSALPPFITSTLQQVAARKLGFSPSYTMGLAQELYESGLITYMRTDSPTLSVEAQQAMTMMITQQFGADYLQSSSASSSGSKKGKVAPKNAQEAHEAIRPALYEGRFRDPTDVRVESTNARALYELIYRRTLASAMRPSKTESVTVSIKASQATNEAILQSSMSTVVDPGYLLCMDPATYQELSKQLAKGTSSKGEGGPFAGLKKGSRLSLAQDYFTSSAAARSSALSSSEITSMVTDDETSDDQDSSSSSSEGVPSSASTMALNTINGALKCTEHATRPPSRFTEASFIKELEARGVGRPSTYSAILAVLKERGYIVVDRQTIVPTGIGLIVARYLRRFFPDIVDDSFTAKMEATLDQIATGTEDKVTFLRRYFLANDTGLFQKLTQTINEAAHDRQGTRSLEIPALKHLGYLVVSNGALYFYYHRPLTDQQQQSEAQATTAVWSTENTTTTSAMTTVRRRLPPSLEQDLRLWTVEAFEALRGDLSAIGPMDGVDLGVGVAKHDQRPYRFFLKNGPYGPFLQMELQVTPSSTNETATTKKKRKTAASSTTLNKAMPAWVNESLTLDDAIDFAALPITIGVYPDTQTNMTLSFRQGHLVVTADGYDFEATLPAHVYVREVDVDQAISALRASSSPRAHASVRVLGTWQDEDIVLGVGRYGPYARWKNVFASLVRWKDSLDKLNVDEVIQELEKKLTKTKAPKKATTKTTTTKAKAKSASGTKTKAALEKDSSTAKAKTKSTMTKKTTKKAIAAAVDGEKKVTPRTRATTASSATSTTTTASTSKTAAVKKTATKKASAVVEAGSDQP